MPRGFGSAHQYARNRRKLNIGTFKKGRHKGMGKLGQTVANVIVGIASGKPPKQTSKKVKRVLRYMRKCEENKGALIYNVSCKRKRVGFRMAKARGYGLSHMSRRK